MIKRLIKGARYSEKYGKHPGTGVLFFFIIMGFVVGFVEGGLSLAFFGSALTAIFFFPLWLVGCWHRGFEENLMR